MPAPTIEEYLPLCFSVARDYRHRYPSVCDDWRELVGGAYTGLVEAVDQFQPRHEASHFAPFAVQRMRWRITDTLRIYGKFKRRLPGAADRPLTYHYFNLDREGREAIEKIPDPILDPMHFAAKRDSAAKLWGVVQESLQPRTALLMVLYYSYGWLFKQIGAHFGVTEARISQLHSHAIETLRTPCVLAGFA